jgi:hypothetical protein
MPSSVINTRSNVDFPEPSLASDNARPTHAKLRQLWIIKGCFGGVKLNRRQTFGDPGTQPQTVKIHQFFAIRLTARLPIDRPGLHFQDSGILPAVQQRIPRATSPLQIHAMISKASLLTKSRMAKF